DRRQVEPVAETVVHRSGQLFGREIARHTVFSLGTAASADGADGDETPLRHLLSIEADRGSAGTIELTDCPALSPAGIEPGRNTIDFATSAGRRCDGGRDCADSERDGRSLPRRGYDDSAAARIEATQRAETGGRKREDARPGQDSRQPPDDLKLDF